MYNAIRNEKQMLYSEMRIEISLNKYMLTELGLDGFPVQGVLPAFFDDLTYNPMGIEFKVKAVDIRGKEESLVYFIPTRFIVGFEFKKNPHCADAKTLRFPRLD